MPSYLNSISRFMTRLFTYLLVFLVGQTLQAQDMIRFQSLMPKKDQKLSDCVHDARTLMEGRVMTIKEVPKMREHANQLLQLGQREYAKEIFEQVVNLSRDAYGPEDTRYIRALGELASAYVLIIRYGEAVGLYEEILTKTKALEGRDSRAYLYALNEAGYCYTRLAQWRRGAVIYDQALDIARNMGLQDTKDYAILLHNRGACFKNNGNLSTALEYYQEAMTLVKGDINLELNIAPNIAEALAMAGTPDKTLLAKYEPIALQQLMGPSIGVARIWMQYGVAYLHSGDLDGAERCLGRALAANSLTFDAVEHIADRKSVV